MQFHEPRPAINVVIPITTPTCFRLPPRIIQELNDPEFSRFAGRSAVLNGRRIRSWLGP